MPYLRRYLTILYFSMSVVPSVSRFYLSGVTFCQEQTFICQKDVLLSSLTKCYGLHFLNLRAWRPLISLFLCLKLTFHTLSFTAHASRCPSSLLQCVLFSCAQSSANSFVLGIPISFPPLQCLNFIFSILPVSLFHPPPLPALFSLGVQPCILVLINVPFTIRRCVKSCFKRDLVKSHLQELLYHKQASLLLVYDWRLFTWSLLNSLQTNLFENPLNCLSVLGVQ